MGEKLKGVLNGKMFKNKQHPIIIKFIMSTNYQIYNITNLIVDVVLLYWIHP